MSMSVGASSNALSYLQSLLEQGSASSSASATTDPLTAFLQGLSGSATSTDPAAGITTSSFDPGSVFDPGTFAALISLQDQSASGAAAQDPSSQLFAKLDTDGDGSISKSEFENALADVGVSTTDADSLFAKLDTNGDGSVSQSELEKAGHGHHHHMHADAGGQAGGASGQSPLDALLSSASADGATTQSTTNADGSTTTTITYADGSTVEMTTPATSTDSSGTGSSSTNSSGGSAVNLIEQLIRMQAQFLNSAASTLSAVA